MIALDKAWARFVLAVLISMVLTTCAFCMPWPRVKTYQDCKTACGELGVVDFRPGCRRLMLCCACGKGEP